MLSIVIVSTPRSGTRYMADLLTACGLLCGHEKYFGPNGPTGLHEMPGESSWLAAPYLHELPADALIVHLTRDPVACINSIIHTGHVRLDQVNSPYVSFLLQHAQLIQRELYSSPLSPEDGFGSWCPERLAEQRRPTPVLQMIYLAQEFWLGWHKLIAARVAGRKYMRCRIEDVSVDLICGLLSSLSVEADRASVEKVLESMPRSINSRGKSPLYIAPAHLMPTVRQLGSEYGYR